MANLDCLPFEILINLTRFLIPLDIVTLQLVCKRLLTLGRDNTLWREQCFNESSFLETLRRRRELITDEPSQGNRFRELARALAVGNGLSDSRLVESQEEDRDPKTRSNEKLRIMANWDPSYPDEKLNWYDEYIARHAPISTSWFQQPRNLESNNAQHEYLEVRGLAIYIRPETPEAALAVAPLDDGSLCLWDITGAIAKKGSIVARSKSGLLSVDPTPQPGTGPRSKMVSTGVTECISVDSARKRAYVAVQSDQLEVVYQTPQRSRALIYWSRICRSSTDLTNIEGLVEVDLETLSTISHNRFPFSITALSEAKHPVPLTVGTNLSLYLQDFRERNTAGSFLTRGGIIDSFDAHCSGTSGSGRASFRSLLNPEPIPEYAHLYQPGPLSILHLPSSANEWDVNGDIYVAGRFPSILNYDRRNFPKLKGTIHSGARLCSIASLPFPFASLEKDLARRGELSVDQVLESKTRPGKTLIACGEYNSKGSLEMYGLSPNPLLTTTSSGSSAGSVYNAVLKNRQTSSSSKLLSVASHGTRIVVSDGGGNLKWLERDGFTEARRWNIAHGSIEAPRGIFGTLGDSYMDTGSGDIVIKILEHQGDLVLWTGEKIGLLTFSSKPGFSAESFEESEKTAEEAHIEREERVYSDTMRRALEHQANEVRYVRGLGLGLGRGAGP